MPAPGEHKTVQARIITYAQEIGWTFVPQKEAERRRGFDPEAPPRDRAKGDLYWERSRHPDKNPDIVSG